MHSHVPPVGVVRFHVIGAHPKTAWVRLVARHSSTRSRGLHGIVSVAGRGRTHPYLASLRPIFSFRRSNPIGRPPGSASTVRSSRDLASFPPRCGNWSGGKVHFRYASKFLCLRDPFISQSYGTEQWSWRRTYKSIRSRHLPSSRRSVDASTRARDPCVPRRRRGPPNAPSSPVPLGAPVRPRGIAGAPRHPSGHRGPPHAHNRHSFPVRALRRPPTG
jgi:hypothetical protein